MKKNILILTSDPNSINYEIIKKSLFFFKKKLKNNYTFVGNKEDINKYIKSSKIKLNFINIRNKNLKQLIKKSVDISVNLIKEKKAHGIINLPLNKKLLPNKYPGFTEFISDKVNCLGNETMLLFNRNFSVSPITTHMLIKDISRNLTKEKIIINITNIYNFYKKILKLKKPKLLINGLNPHCGIDFAKKNEEEKIIIPVIKKLKKIIDINGPISPDSAFNVAKKNNINCLIGLYHDQILPTFKYIYGYEAINITLGLPFFRISPDHGTAKNIVNKNLANPKSFLYALEFFEKYHKVI